MFKKSRTSSQDHSLLKLDRVNAAGRGNLAFNRHQAGFTMIELVMLILIIGIISVVVMPTWLAPSVNLEYETRHLLSDIRYTQALSLTSGQRYRWVQLSSTSYAIRNEAGTAVQLPNGGTTMTLGVGISFGSLSNLPNNLVAFDSQGVPYTTSSSPGTALAATANIPLMSNGRTRTVQISPTTGYGAIQ